MNHLQDVIFRGDPSIRRISDLKYFVSKLKVEAEEASRLAGSLDDFVSLSSRSGMETHLIIHALLTLKNTIVA